MSNSSTKKSVFDRIGSTGSNSSGTTNLINKSTHGFCTNFLKTGTCSLGDSCKYIHEQITTDKSSISKDEMRITKTTTRVVDMSSTPIKSTITVSNEQRPVVVSNSSQSTRTVVESVNTPTTDHSQDRRSSGSDKKQARTHSSDSKSKSSPKKKTQSSSHENRHSSTKKIRPNDSDSPVSSASDTEQPESSSSHKHKQKSSSHSQSSKHRKYESISPHHNDDETLNDQINRQNSVQNKSPKRTIVISERKKEENAKSSSKTSKPTKSNPDIEFLGSKKVNRDEKSTETIHQQAEYPKKTIEIKREKKSPAKSIDRQRQHSSSMNSTTEKTKTDQLSSSHENDKSNVVQPSSPICVILDDDSDPAPLVDKKSTEKKTNESEKTSKSSKRSREPEKSHSSKDKTSSEHSEAKRKRLSDESSRKPTSSSKSTNDSRSTSNRSDVRRSANTSSRDESSSRKYKEKTSRTSESSKDRTTTTITTSSLSKTHSSHDRRDTTRSSSDKKYSSHRRRKDKDLENVTDSEEHTDEIILPKQTAFEAYMSMDWSLLSRDKRLPLNTQTASRTIQTSQPIIACERLLTNEQKQELNQIECHDLPLTQFMKQLQIKPRTQLVNSCQRRFGSCAKDMIEMRHQWFIKSIEPAQQYEFINKEHFLAFQRAMNCLFDETTTDVSSTQIEPTTTDVLLS